MSEPLQIFLVEGEDDFAHFTRAALERAGHQVTLCHSGADALIVLGHSTFHLVILNQHLPDMNGLELVHALCRESSATPILVVTGTDTQNLAAQALHAGALDYLVKDKALTYLAELPKRVQEAVTRHRLQQANSLMIGAIESAHDGILITDLQGTIQHVNRALEAKLGYPRQELIGQSPRLFRSGMHERCFFEEMWRTILNRASWQGELVNKRRDGTLIDISLTISPILDSRGQMTHFVGIYRDISERKLMERQLFQAQKMQSVGTLAGGVAHEFNNLLAGIQGYASLGLRESGLSANIRQFLDTIVQLSDRAAHLTRQLLAYARKPALRRRPTVMEALLRDTVEMVQTSLRISVAMEIKDATVDGEPLIALADANQLQQVLINLALNARDALPQDTAEGDVRARASHPPIVFRLSRQVVSGETSAFPQNIPAGDYAVFEIEDRGSGMAPEVLAQAFDPFFTTKQIGQGTGLGLPVAFGIMHGHHGFLTIATKVGRGTRARLYLPRLVRAAVEVGAGTTPQVLEPESAPGRHILMVDDEHAVLDVVRRFLEIAGHKVTPASSGAEALAVLERIDGIEMIVLDLMIPREEGSTNFRRLRERVPQLPIVLCTGHIDQEQANQLMQEGAAEVLHKPFRMNELWYAVNKALER
ncbi:MAG: response regulator [Planctomycetes bacterium]|nr:response regulator [Planctomycetota bacterium]